ncbi:bifunctional folylpolyglutamate synthase/dihydrofolate synthase [Robertkochia aurantiaca]|uniref:bifunctional folylpolyglutamate synthase/dihydrofolate synthase n=1 Tax=Robertkochia aurantiaca TaxID=2873700 RepID=UPI001CC9D58E|nr:folylpolyglutamate synthase/dihydrofolate synthase family protein [Robertkochia sp. 3YJGBD-33]
MTYEETLQWLFTQLPMYQRQGATALKPKLENTQALVKHLGYPHHKFPTIHVAGTNGKGSVSHMIASILQESGLRVGLYTSPHLRDFRERIKINGELIPEEDVVSFVENHQAFFREHSCSFFEMTVGMAFDYFAREETDIAVIEVGLGGRLDSTNVITPEVSVITNIGFDHAEILGDTLEKIAAEKGGIIKPKVPVVISEYQDETFPVFLKIAAEMEAPVIRAWEKEMRYVSDLKGGYQDLNIPGAVAAVRALPGIEVGEDAIERGLLNVVRNTGLLGRWQQLDDHPRIICDTAHNAEGLALVMEQLSRESFRKLHMVFGVVKEKDLSKILPLLPEDAFFYFCKPDVPRGLEAQILQEKAHDYGLKGEVFASVSEALESARKQAATNDLIYVGGSTFTVAEIV